MNQFPYPIKLINLRKEDIKKNQNTGGEKKVFQEVTRDLREHFSGKVTEISKLFESRFQKYPNVPSVAKVKLRSDAIAKSHRPTSLFSTSTCPIIGVGQSDELYIEVTPNGLTQLAEKITSSTAKITKANISTLDDITAYTPKDIIDNATFAKLKELNSKHLKIKLFDFHQHIANIEAHKVLLNHLQDYDSELVKTISYSKELIVYKVAISNLDHLYELADYGPIRTISNFPLISHFQAMTSLAEPNELPEFIPIDGYDYPYVAVVDSGIREDHPQLKYWVERREDYVLPNEKNCEHGSFVGGIISYGDRIDGVKTPFDGIKIIDIAAIPNSDEKYGDVGALTEDDLVEILQETVPKYSGKVKVWNLSLGTNQVCKDEAFSDLAIALDEIQDENDVIFVIAAGNYEDKIRPWPPTDPNLFDDRLTTPGDSVRAITVGAISHIETEITKVFDPSPFSRRGPGPNYIIKPELVDFGGTMSISPPSIKGVRSFDEYGNLHESVGTSYSTPRVASLLAKLYHYSGHPLSRNLAKALLIHSAVNPKTGNPPQRDEMKYLGFGQPKGIIDILNCSESSLTMVFEGIIYPSTHIEITDFPFPQTLVEQNKCFGEIFMTLVYTPPVDARYGFEYCRSNIEVSLGTDKPKGYSGEVPLERMGEIEKELVENGFKWSPIKVYHRKFDRGIADHQWMLKIYSQSRSNEIPAPQSFALVITVSDPKGEKTVYNDISQQLEQRFLYRDLHINNQIRLNP